MNKFCRVKRSGHTVECIIAWNLYQISTLLYKHPENAACNNNYCKVHEA